MTEFGEYFQEIIVRARAEALQDASSEVEAGHLLLAIAANQDDASGRILSAAGLDYQAVRAALDREFERSLNAAGVSASAFGLPPATIDPDRRTKLGASARLAIIRAVDSAGRKKDLRPAHLLLGILEAQAGSVPRALALAGVDQSGLTERVRQAVPADAPG